MKLTGARPPIQRSLRVAGGFACAGIDGSGIFAADTAAQATMIIWRWALAQYPAIIPGRLTIEQAAAPQATLELVLWALAAGSAVLLPSLLYLFRLLKTRASAPD